MPPAVYGSVHANGTPVFERNNPVINPADAAGSAAAGSTRAVLDLVHQTGSDGTAILLAVEDIRPNPRNPRQHFSEEGLQQLADSIRQWGQIQPIVVRRTKERGYQLICGERRWRAHKKAGLEHIWAVVRDVSDQDTIALMLVENLHRVNLSHVERVAALDQLAELTCLSGLRKVAKHLRVDPGWLSRQLAIRRDGIIFPAVEQGRIGFGQAAELLRAPLNARQALLERVLEAPERVPTATIRAWVEEAREERHQRPRLDNPQEIDGQDSPRFSDPPREENPYQTLLAQLESFGVPRSPEECYALFALSRRARQLIAAAGIFGRRSTLKKESKLVELDCMMCGEQAGVLETRVKVRLGPGARVRRKGNTIVCGRCGGTLTTGDRAERLSPLAT